MSDGIDGVKPGARIFCGDDVRTVDSRKDDDSGWWLTDGSGLADWIADESNWCLLEGSAPFEAGRASVLADDTKVLIGRDLLRAAVDLIQDGWGTAEKFTPEQRRTFEALLGELIVERPSV